MDRTEERARNKAIFERDKRQCTACGISLPWTLTVHHIIPRELGGFDKPANLTTLCANCHRTVHWLAIGSRLDGRSTAKLRGQINPQALGVLVKFASAARKQRQDLQLDGNRWSAKPGATRPLLPFAKAVSSLLQKHRFVAAEARVLRQALERIVAEIPPQVRRGCSARIVRNGRYLSINAGNHLLCRFPAIMDDGTRIDADFILIWPKDTRISFTTSTEWKQLSAGSFEKIPCFNFGTNAEQVLKLTAGDWAAFATACTQALEVGKTRTWMSNVGLP